MARIGCCSIKEEYNNIPDAVAELEKLNSHGVAVGILEDDFLQMIAVVNNDGTTIEAKPGNYLMIPYQDNGKLKFAKKKSVKIPARHFLERTISNHDFERQEWATNQIAELLEGHQSAMSILRGLGEETVREMKITIGKFSNPKNAPLTVANKGFNDPLVDTGKLRNSIAYKIIEL